MLRLMRLRAGRLPWPGRAIASGFQSGSGGSIFWSTTQSWPGGEQRCLHRSPPGVDTQDSTQSTLPRPIWAAISTSCAPDRVTDGVGSPPGLAGTKCARCARVSPLTRSLYLTLVALLFGLFAWPAHAKMYSCQDAAGRVILRDLPCKRGERDIAAARMPAPSPTGVRQVENANPITEDQVQELVDGIETAKARRDVAATLAFVAPDAVFELEYRLPQGLQFKRFNKDEYAAYLRGGPEFVDALDFQRESTRILVAPDTRQAEITSTLRERVRIRGEALTRVTRSKSLVEIRDGRPVIILVRAVMRFEVAEKASRTATQGNDRASGR